jgi:hypothetical protein
MIVRVEPQDGDDLERLITALVNATGAVHRVIDSTEHRPDADGVEVIDLVAERLHGILALMAEHRSDDELDFVTGALAEVTLLIADELDLHGLLSD